LTQNYVNTFSIILINPFFVWALNNPLIQFNVIEFFIEQSKGYDCCIPQWDNGFLELLLAIYPNKKTLKKLTENLRVNDLKLTNVIDKSWKINYISIENSIKPLEKNSYFFKYQYS